MVRRFGLSGTQLQVTIVLLGIMLLIFVGAIVTSSEGVNENIGKTGDKTEDEVDNQQGSLQDNIKSGIEEGSDVSGLKDRMNNIDNPFDGGSSTSTSGGGGTNTDSTDDSSSDDSTSDPLDDIGTGKPSADTYDIFFAPAIDAYGNDPEFEKRVDRYMRGIVSKTPFRECPKTLTKQIQKKGIGGLPSDVQKAGQKVHNAPMPDKADMWIVLAKADQCDAFNVQGKIAIWNGLPSGYDEIVVAHEMGHEFGLCDEYNRDLFNKQAKDFGGQCGNSPWPGDNGWYYSGAILAEDPQGNPTQIEPVCGKIGKQDGRGQYQGADYTAGTCGRDLDGDPSTRKAAIMGGGGALKTTMSPDGSKTCTGMAIEQPEFHEISYNAFKKKMNDRGIKCGG